MPEEGTEEQLEYNKTLYRRYPNAPEEKSVEFIDRLLENIKFQKKYDECAEKELDAQDEDDLMIIELVKEAAEEMAQRRLKKEKEKMDVENQNQAKNEGAE